MKRIVLLVICMFFVTGCTMNYEINFGRTVINENISAEMDGNIYEVASSIDGDGFYLEKELVEGKIPSLKGYKDYYSRKIRVEGNTSYVDLNYKYSYDNYKDSYVLSRCFEKSYVENTEDYIYVSLGGNFKCFKEDDIRIKVSTVYDVIKHNANEVKDNDYIWDIKLSDDENKVELYIAKEIIEKETKSSFDIKVIIFIAIVILGIVILSMRNKIKNN